MTTRSGLEAAREALALSEGHERQDLESNRMIVLVIVKSLEIIGEAASKVSENCQDENEKT